MSRFLIYALVDPRTDAVRYIGQSSSGLARPRDHAKASALKSTTNTYKANWIRGLMAAGLNYEVRVLEEVAQQDDLDEAEVRWIAHGRAQGWPLTNLTAGGERGVRSQETRDKLRALKTGKPCPWLVERNQSEEHRAKVRASKTGKSRAPFSDEWRRHLSEGKKGRPKSAAHRAALSAAQVGRVVSEETRRKISETRKRRMRPRMRINLLGAEA